MEIDQSFFISSWHRKEKSKHNGQTLSKKERENGHLHI